jgi:phosphatidylinositol-3-phosphatase
VACRGGTGFRWSLLALLVLSLLALGVHSTAGARSAGDPCGKRRGHAPKRYRHVIIIVMENHSYSAIDGSSPYLNGLARQCGLATKDVAITHPSLPNYIALTSGDTRGISDDCTDCSTNAPSIFQQVGPQGWRAYEESMPSPGFKGGGSGDYAKKHNPAAYYTRIAKAYARNAVPLGTASNGALVSDLRKNRLRRYSFITPNLCNDEHDCDIATGDAWLRLWVSKIVRSAAYRKGGTALFITYDEGEGSDQRVYTVVVSPYTKPATVSAARFSHYSLLKTAEGMLGVRCLAHACQAGTLSMRRSFGLSRRASSGVRTD